MQWPGKTFDMDRAEALAALASPNGRGIAYLFAQHKDLFGVRTADEFRVFNCGEDTPRWCMYFHLWDPDSMDMDST